MIAVESFDEFREEMFGKMEEIAVLSRNVFDPRQAATYLSISYDTVLREARIGNLNHSKNGRCYLFTKEDLDDWVELKRVRKAR